MPPAPADRRIAGRIPIGAVSVVVAAFGGLLLVALAARSRPTVNVRPVRRPTDGVTVSPPPSSVPSLPGTARVPGRDTHVPTWLLLVLALAVVALLVPVLIVLINALRRLLRRWTRHTAGGRRTPTGEAMADDPIVDRELADGVDEGLNRLDQGPVREAIIACWIELERAAARADVTPLPAETAAELAARLLGARAVDAGSLERLADLYREARFSAHALDEARRDEARASLQRIRADLTRQAAAALARGEP